MSDPGAVALPEDANLTAYTRAVEGIGDALVRFESALDRLPGRDARQAELVPLLRHWGSVLRREWPRITDETEIEVQAHDRMGRPEDGRKVWYRLIEVNPARGRLKNRRMSATVLIRYNSSRQMLVDVEPDLPGVERGLKGIYGDWSDRRGLVEPLNPLDTARVQAELKQVSEKLGIAASFVPDVDPAVPARPPAAEAGAATVAAVIR